MNVTTTNNIYSLNSIYSFLIQIAPYIIALMGVLISFYSLINQRKITQKQINAETKRKFIVDLIEQCKLISKSVWTLFETASDFSVSKKKYADLIEMMETVKNQDNPEMKNELKSLLDFHNHNVDNSFNQIFKTSKEFYYNVSSIFLYLPRNHKETESLRTIATDLEHSFQRYSGHFNFEGNKNIEDKEEIELGDKLGSHLEIFKNKVHELIDNERNDLEHIL